MKLLTYPLLFLSLLLVSCESEYSKIVKRELKSGVVHDDLIFDMKLGQTQKEFYATCWDLNERQLISQGSGNRYAKYIMTLDSASVNPQKVVMLFYGIFDQEKIMWGMDMKMSYMSWAPWNEAYHSDRLMEKLQEKYTKEYPGNPFIKINIDGEKQAYAKVDGNRRILMYPLNDKDIAVKIEDLRQII